MTDQVSAITDKDFLKRVSGQIKMASVFGVDDTTFTMKLSTAKRLLALAEAGMPKTDVAVPPMIDVTPTVGEQHEA